jgi:hypothetical protein
VRAGKEQLPAAMDLLDAIPIENRSKTDTAIAVSSQQTRV